MREQMRQALFEMYDLMDEAKARQEEHGGHDTGNRSKTTSGKHLDKVLEVIVDNLKEGGYSEEDLIWKGKKPTIPGWFRPSKCWDLLVMDGDSLLVAVELKSISSSYGNNANNRAEEALGSARDAEHAFKNNLLSPQTTPPEYGFAIIIRDCDGSRKRVRLEKAIRPTDPVFNGTSYLDRLTITARRLLSEGIYQAVWVAYVNVEENYVEEDPELTYESFLEALKSPFRIKRQATASWSECGYSQTPS